jgi:heptaprenyl diphosphate synthase
MADALARTEAELRTVVESGDPFLTEVARHLIDAGGKRVRPALTVTAAQVLDPDPGVAIHGVIRGGVAVELVHQGSLYHDDVMDGAETRRTVQSVNARWGNREAILAGDYLLARASEIAADLGT